MGIIEIFFIGVGLSMDAFAVAVCTGISGRRIALPQALKVAVAFGFFQGLMPLLGWWGGSYFEAMIASYDHWIAFALLTVIGGKMLHGALKGKEAQVPVRCAGTHLPTLLMMSVATSIDALAVGVSFAFLQVKIISAAGIIALTTFVISLLGVYLGKKGGSLLGNRAEIVGGIVLIVIGFKILLGF